MVADLERQIWDLLEPGAMTRDMLERHLPRCSPEAIRIKVLAMKGRQLLGIDAQQNIFRLASEYRPAFISVARPAADPISVTERKIAIESTPAQTTSEPEGNIMAKTCTLCGEEKPLSDFYKNQGRCKPCFNKKQRENKVARAAAAGAKVAPKARKVARKAAAAGNGKGQSAPPAVARDHAFHIPAGREISGDVVRTAAGIKTLELTGGFPGKEPDQHLTLTRDEAILLHGWLGHLLAAQ